MAVGFLDNTASTHSAATLSYSVTAGTNRYLIAASFGSTTNTAVSAAAYGGQTMTQLFEESPGAGITNISAWGINDALIAAATDTNIVFTGGGSVRCLVARSFEHVDQSSPVAASTGMNHYDDGTTAVGSMDVAKAAGGATWQAVGVRRNGIANITMDGDLTERIEVSDDGGTLDAMLACGDVLTATSGVADGSWTWPGGANEVPGGMISLANATSAVGFRGYFGLRVAAPQPI